MTKLNPPLETITSLQPSGLVPKSGQALSSPMGHSSSNLAYVTESPDPFLCLDLFEFLYWQRSRNFVHGSSTNFPKNQLMSLYIKGWAYLPRVCLIFTMWTCLHLNSGLSNISFVIICLCICLLLYFMSFWSSRIDQITSQMFNIYWLSETKKEKTCSF